MNVQLFVEVVNNLAVFGVKMVTVTTRQNPKRKDLVIYKLALGLLKNGKMCSAQNHAVEESKLGTSPAQWGTYATPNHDLRIPLFATKKYAQFGWLKIGENARKPVVLDRRREMLAVT